MIFKMKKTKLTSKSFVLLDAQYNGILPQSGSINKNDSPFFEISMGLLKRIFKDIKIPVSSSSISSDFREKYSFNNNEFQIVNEFIPPRLNIIHKTDDEKDTTFLMLTKEILESIDERKIGAVGVNYGFNVSQSELDYKKIVNESFRNGLENINTKLGYYEEEYYLYITISNENSISDYINVSANFHFQDISNTNLSSVLEMNLLEAIRNKKIFD